MGKEKFAPRVFHTWLILGSFFTAVTGGFSEPGAVWKFLGRKNIYNLRPVYSCCIILWKANISLSFCSSISNKLEPGLFWVRILSDPETPDLVGIRSGKTV
jgi:hypothetical protein